MYVEGSHVAKKPKLDIPLSEQVLMSTIPYHSIGYEEQVSNSLLLCNTFQSPMLGFL